MSLSGAGAPVTRGQLNNALAVDGAYIEDFGTGADATVSIGFAGRRGFVGYDTALQSMTIGGSTVGGSKNLRLFAAGSLAILIDAFRRVTFSRAVVTAPAVLAYSAAIAIDASLANAFEVTPTDGVAFALNAPTNPFDGQEIEVTIRNTFGVLGALTFNAVFKLGGAWVQPANGFSRAIRIRYRTGSASWVEKMRTAVDVPN